MIPLELIRRHADRQPHQLAVTDEATVLTWQEFYKTVWSVRNWMATELGSVDRVGGRESAELRAVAYADNTVELVVATAAAASLGIAWVGIDPSRDAETALDQLAAVRPDLLIVDSGVGDGRRLAEQAGRAGARVLDLGSAPAADVRGTAYAAACDAHGPAVGWQAPPFLALGFTSGSTGKPKLFLRRSRSENQRLAYLRDTFGFSGENRDAYLVTSPLAHASGHVWANAALSLGASVVLGSTDPNRLVDQLAEHRITAAFMVPPTLEAFLAAAQGRPDADLTSLRALLTGGRHISARAIRHASQRLGDVLHLYYATTETGINTFAGPAQLAANPFTAGFPLAGVHLVVVDEHTHQPMPPEAPGLIAIASTLNLDRYQTGKPDVVEHDSREHVLTSDYGYLGADGQLFILGRSDSLPGGDRLNVVLLEAELKELPNIQDACIVRRPTSDGVEVVAVVRLPDSAPAEETLASVSDRLGQLLGPATQAHRVLAVPEIPYNTAGKVDVRAMRAILAGYVEKPLAIA